MVINYINTMKTNFVFKFLLLTKLFSNYKFTSNQKKLHKLTISIDFYVYLSVHAV